MRFNTGIALIFVIAGIVAFIAGYRGTYKNAIQAFGGSKS